MSNQVIGNGFNDDTAYLQELLDKRGKVYFPEAEKYYQISKTLKIHSDTQLCIDRFTEIRLMDNSDCLMLENDEPRNWNKNISIEGGIWNFRNLNQAPNPCATGNRHVPSTGGPFNSSEYFDNYYIGKIFRFSHVKNLTIKNMTVKDPVTYAINLGFVENFTIRDIDLDYNLGNPYALNMDGIHIDGGCRYGYIENIKGTAYDDLVAITSNDACSGPISDITINGLYSEGCHSAVRVLSVYDPVKNINVSNVYGTFYRYAVCISQFHHVEGAKGSFSNLTFKNLAVSRAPLEKKLGCGRWKLFGLFHIGDDIDIDSLSIESLSRQERVNPVETIFVGENVRIENLSITNCVQKNLLDHPDYIMGEGHKDDIDFIRDRNKDTNDIIFLLNNGKIDNLTMTGMVVDGTVIENNGTIDALK